SRAGSTGFEACRGRSISTGIRSHSARPRARALALRRSKRALGLDRELPAVDLIAMVQRRGEIDVHDLPAARAGRRQAQPGADVRERADGRRGPRILAPYAADIEEHGVADAEQPQRIPAGEEALLERQHGAMR